MENQFNPEFLPDLELAETSEREFTFWVYDMSNQNYLISLLDRASFEAHRRDAIESEINDVEGMTEDKYREIATVLQANQMDVITSGFPYSARDIKNHLRKLK